MKKLEDEVIDFLIRENALRLGESPWGTYGDEDEVYSVNWKSLFPKLPVEERIESFDEMWRPRLPEDFLDEVEEVIQEARTSRSELQKHKDIHGHGRHFCAWYQPIHFYKDDWGIYIREECIIKKAQRIATRYPRLPISSIYDLAKNLIRVAVSSFFLHEHFHHKVECLGLRLHVTTKKSVYPDYKTNVYKTTYGTDDCLEESLANADAWIRLNNNPYKRIATKHVTDAARQYLKDRFAIDPPGYRKALDYLKKEQFTMGENLLQAQVRECAMSPIRPIDEWNAAPRLLQSFFNVTNNIWSVVRRGTTPILPVNRRKQKVNP
jgi:hypothetical protein